MEEDAEETQGLARPLAPAARREVPVQTADSTLAAQCFDTETSLEVLREDAICLSAYALTALGILLNVVLVFWHVIPPLAWLIELSLVVTGILTLKSLSASPRLAGPCLVVGLTATMLVAVWLFPAAPLICSLPVVVIFAGAFHGWRTGAATAVGITAAIALLAGGADSPISTEVAGTAVALSWLNVLASWLISRPLQVALDWWWHSYTQAMRALDQARDRQGELGRLSKSLTETCGKLEQMNRELEHARNAAEEARRLKNQFVAAVSHELRTPLNLIIGFSEMMIISPKSSYGEALPEGYAEDLEAIYRNACHISALVDDILDLSQIDAVRMGLQRQRVALARITEEAASSIGAQFENKGLTLTVDVPPNLPMLYADPTRIRQILINLLINALRFTDHGGVTVRAEYNARAQEIRVAVADTGVGIAAEDLPHVFDEFRQSKSPERRRGGSGLGLAVTKRFVEMHGGAIWVESELGVGSTFHFSLPLSESVVASPYVSLPVPATVAPGGNTAPKAIVVLDGDGETARVLERYLDDYAVARAGSVEQALRIAQERPVHAVLADSCELAERWRLMVGRDWLQRLPIVTCSLHTARSLARGRNGVAGYLLKPVTSERLHAVLGGLGTGNGRKRRVRSVVIADDELEMQRLLARMVHSWSWRCQVWTASDGAECLELLHEHRPDALLLDLLMPRVDGYSVIEQMQADERLAGIPVVVVTARGDQDETVSASSVAITRPCGLSVADAIACLKGALDALTGQETLGPAGGKPSPQG